MQDTESLQILIHIYKYVPLSLIYQRTIPVRVYGKSLKIQRNVL